LVGAGFGSFHTRLQKFTTKDCDVINKIAYKPFPSWKVSWPRTDFTPSLSKWQERKPTIEVSFSYRLICAGVNLKTRIPSGVRSGESC
jgi:hypothetical protein